MKEGQGKRVAVYCRVDAGGSPEARLEALSVQRQRLENYAQRRGLEISGCYGDNGLPGNEEERPGMKQLMRDYQEGLFEEVLVVNRSRLYRGSREKEPSWPFLICSLNELEQRELDLR